MVEFIIEEGECVFCKEEWRHLWEKTEAYKDYEEHGDSWGKEKRTRYWDNYWAGMENYATKMCVQTADYYDDFVPDSSYHGTYWHMCRQHLLEAALAVQEAEDA